MQTSRFIYILQASFISTDIIVGLVVFIFKTNEVLSSHSLSG